MPRQSDPTDPSLYSKAHAASCCVGPFLENPYEVFGSPGRTRTCNLAVNSRSLHFHYPLKSNNYMDKKERWLFQWRFDFPLNEAFQFFWNNRHLRGIAPAIDPTRQRPTIQSAPAP